MKIMKALGELVSPNDPELVEKTLSRIAEQDIGTISSPQSHRTTGRHRFLKSEIRGRARATEDIAVSAVGSLGRAEPPMN